MNDEEQTNLLIEIKTKLDDLILQFNNHLTLHRSISVAMISIMGTLVVGIVIALLV